MASAPPIRRPWQCLPHLPYQPAKAETGSLTEAAHTSTCCGTIAATAPSLFRGGWPRILAADGACNGSHLLHKVCGH
ncbi:hypothetical protein HaLaN_19277, partial [Haematococcus lacustris]